MLFDPHSFDLFVSWPQVHDYGVLCEWVARDVGECSWEKISYLASSWVSKYCALTLSSNLISIVAFMIILGLLISNMVTSLLTDFVF